MDCNSAIPQKVQYNDFLCIVYNFGGIRSKNLRVYATFCGHTAKIGISRAKYLTISWTYLDLLYRFGSRISGDDFPNICLAFAQLNMGDVRKRQSVLLTKG